MAKKAKTESVLSKQTRLKAAADATEAARAEEVARAAAEQAAAEAKEAERKAVTPRAARPPKVKKARFVRAAKEQAPGVPAAAPTPRSTTAAGKMMTRNVTAVPKDEPRAAAPPEGRRKP
jgi:hypothetical protein